MGTIVKQDRISGPTLEEAFRKLQEEDNYESGHDIYSGSWGNCVNGIKEVSAEEFDRKAQSGDISKHEPAIAKCVQKPIKNPNKIKTEVLRHPNSGTRKWKTVYVAVPDDHYSASRYPIINIMEDKQADAITKAREYVEKHPKVSLRIQIGKKLIGEGGEELVAEVRYKSSSKERDGIWEIMGGMSY